VLAVDIGKDAEAPADETGKLLQIVTAELRVKAVEAHFNQSGKRLPAHGAAIIISPQKGKGTVLFELIEKRNRSEIEKLNQRGGRTLTIVDLIRAGTLSIDMAAYLMMKMHGGASILTGAVPGGAGKTTLLASQLHAVAAGSAIIPVDSEDILDSVPEGESKSYTYLLAHEIGSGSYYGYIWGAAARRYMGLNKKGNIRIASCLHADTLEEMRQIMLSSPLNVSAEDFSRIDLILFMSMGGGYAHIKRRVSAMYEADGKGGHRLLYRHDGRSDTFVAATKPDSGNRLLQRCRTFIASACEENLTDDRAYRKAVCGFYRSLKK